MKPINQTKNWSTCLHGWTLPKNSLYGFIHGKEYVCINANIETGAGYRIKIWNAGKGAWFDRHTKDGHGDIYVRIRDFKKTAAFCADAPIACHSVTLPERQKQAEAVKIAKAIEAQRRQRAWDNAMREIGCPQEKRPGAMIYRGIPERATAGNAGGVWEETAGMALAHYVGADGMEEATARKMPPPKYWEAGQNTCGSASNPEKGAPYTRSGYETRDGMKTRFVDYHGQKPERPTISNPYRVEKDEQTGKHYRTYNGVRIEE